MVFWVSLDHPSRPGRPHVTKVSDREAFLIWEEPDSDGNSYIQSYKIDFYRPGQYTVAVMSDFTNLSSSSFGGRNT